MRAWIAKESPNLIIRSGDISLDGADMEDDFTFCREIMAELPASLLVIPGNHDVGEPKNQHQPADAEATGALEPSL